MVILQTNSERNEIAAVPVVTAYLYTLWTLPKVNYFTMLPLSLSLSLSLSRSLSLSLPLCSACLLLCLPLQVVAQPRGRSTRAIEFERGQHEGVNDLGWEVAAIPPDLTSRYNSLSLSLSVFDSYET